MQDKERDLIEITIETHMKSATEAIIAAIATISEACGDHSEKPE